MTASEFVEWQAFFEAEEIHPEHDRLRHAQVIAAQCNGPVQKKGGGMFVARDFMVLPWQDIQQEKEEGPPSFEELQAQVASLNSRLEP